MDNTIDKEQPVQQFAGLVVSIIKNLNIPHSLYDDCYQCGMIGMLKGLDTFNPKRGILTSHIYNNIRWEILKYLKKEYKHQTVELYDNIPIDHWNKQKNITITNIEDYLPKLNKLERDIIDLKLQSYSLKQISEKLNLSNSYFIYKKYQEILQKIKDAQ